MNNGEKIVIASTSDAFIDYVEKRLEELGERSKIYKAQDENALNECLKINLPQILLIENSFWHNATPLKLLDLINRFGKLRIYVFEVADYTKKFIKRLIRVGINGYLTVRNGRGEFRNELNEALSGKAVIPNEIKADNLDFIPESSEQLTIRDMQIIDLLCEEMDNKEIGETLHIKEQSVKNQKSKIYKKFNVKNTVGLLKCLLRKNIIDVSDFLAG